MCNIWCLLGYYGEILFILLSLELEIVGFHCLMLILETSIHASWDKLLFSFVEKKIANFGVLLVS